MTRLKFPVNTGLTEDRLRCLRNPAGGMERIAVAVNAAV